MNQERISAYLAERLNKVTREPQAQRGGEGLGVRRKAAGDTAVLVASETEEVA